MGGCPQAGTWIYRPWHLYSLSIRIAVYRSNVLPRRTEAPCPAGPDRRPRLAEMTAFGGRPDGHFATIREVHDLGHGYWQLSRNGH